MAPRASWKGFLKLSLVSVPVKAYTATSGEGADVRLNQLHNECHSRIKYKKMCPVHGEVAQDEIISGYEYAKDQYVVIDPDELDKLRTADASKGITFQEFIDEDAVDPMYFRGTTYYIVPDGPVGQRPYVVLRQGMIEQKRFGIAQMVLHGKEQVVLVRPVAGLLAVNPLNYDHHITKPTTFEDEVPKVDPAPEELKLVKALIDASTNTKFDFAKYKDDYQEKLTRLIEAKVSGEEIVAPPVQEHAQVINLMDALKLSVEKMQQKQEEPAEKPPAKMAPSKRPKQESKKKKTS